MNTPTLQQEIILYLLTITIYYGLVYLYSGFSFASYQRYWINSLGKMHYKTDAHKENICLNVIPGIIPIIGLFLITITIIIYGFQGWLNPFGSKALIERSM